MTEYETLPDGTYVAKWSGHTLKVPYMETELTIQTVLGVRGLNIPVVFKFKRGRVIEDSIEELKNHK